MIFKILACVVLIIFYAIYFIKIMIQKNSGIRTHQIGTRREKQIHRVEAWMSVATVSIVVVQVFSIWTDWSWLPDDTRLQV